MLVVQGDQAVGGHGLERRPLRGKIAAKVDIERLLHGRERQVQIADDLLDDLATDTVILIAYQATAGGELAAGQGVLVFGQVAVILAVQVADLADGGDTKPDQVAMAVGGLTLEVALQG